VAKLDPEALPKAYPPGFQHFPWSGPDPQKTGPNFGFKGECRRARARPSGMVWSTCNTDGLWDLNQGLKPNKQPDSLVLRPSGRPLICTFRNASNNLPSSVPMPRSGRRLSCAKTVMLYLNVAEFIRVKAASTAEVGPKRLGSVQSLWDAPPAGVNDRSFFVYSS
jgi:hypothetical protein